MAVSRQLTVYTKFRTPSTQVENPLLFIEQICFEASAFLPIYYFADLAGLDTLEKLKKVVEGVNSASSSRKVLLQRLDGQDDLSSPVPGVNCRQAGKLKKGKLVALLDKELGAEEGADGVLYALEAVRCLSSAQVDVGYLNPLLLRWFEKFYTRKGFPDRFRRAISHLDRVCFRPLK